MIAEMAINITSTYFLFKNIHRLNLKTIFQIGAAGEIFLIVLLYNAVPVYYFIIIFAIAKGIFQSFYWSAFDLTFLHI